MGRVRGAQVVRTLLALALAGLVVVSASAHGRRPPAALDAAALAAVSWPPSTGLVVSEVVTGGGSASDEFIEIYNASGADIDLNGLELVYATSTGSTVTRKQSWTTLVVPARRHLLIANSSGTYASVADGQYSGGLSASGGSAVLRVIAGSVIDALSWGDASSGFVEGTAGPAPPASSSLERRQGGSAGNATDTNVNSADAIVNAAPIAQPLSAAAVPSATPTPTVVATPSATAPPTPTEEPTLTPEPTPPCTPDEPPATPETTLEPTLEPTSTLEPTALPTVDPPTPTVSAIASEPPSTLR